MSNILLKPYFWKLLIKKMTSGLFSKIKNSRLKQFRLTIFMLPSILVLVFVTIMQLKQIYLGEMSHKGLVDATNGETALVFWLNNFAIYLSCSILLRIILSEEDANSRKFWLLMSLLTFVGFTLNAVGIYVNAILIPTLILITIAGGFIFFIVMRTANFNAE